VRKTLVVIAAPLCVATAFLTAWLFELSTEHVLVLAPVIVVVTGGIVGLLLLWARMFWESVLRRSK
jgi:hypothetical protein